MRPHGSPAILERRRLQAIGLLRAGEPFRTVADIVGSSLSSVVRWNQSYQKHGKRGLCPRNNPGRPSWLSAQNKEKLVALLLGGPLSAGYTTDLWTLKRIEAVIGKHFGVHFSCTGVWKLLRGLGWSCQKPEKKARERDEAAIRQWKACRWPHIKKGRSTRSASGFPR